MTEGFFPGSRQPLSPPPGLPSDVRIPDDLGKDYPVKGQTVRLYGIGDVARLLNREPATIRKWERNGTIPKATYVKPGRNKDPRGRRRLYSRAQVEALHRIAMAEGILRNPNMKIGQTNFTDRVFAEFREIQ